MTAEPEEIIRAFARDFGTRDIRCLAAYLAEDIHVQLPDVPLLDGRAAVTAFLRRLLHTYPSRELRLQRCISDPPIIIAEAVFSVTSSPTAPLTRRGLSIFEVSEAGIARWSDYSDLEDALPEERDRWRRLGRASW